MKKKVRCENCGEVITDPYFCYACGYNQLEPAFEEEDDE